MSSKARSSISQKAKKYLVVDLEVSTGQLVLDGLHMVLCQMAGDHRVVVQRG